MIDKKTLEYLEMNITLPDHIELSEVDKEKLKSLGNVTIYIDVPKSEEEIIKRIHDAEIITANWIDITENIIKATPTLKYIIVPAVGYEWIDIKAANKAGIKVINCPIFNTRAVAEYTIALMFAVTRRIVEANTALKNGEWKPRIYKGIELRSKTLGLIGYGNIGKQVSALAHNLGMKVNYANSQSTSQEIDTIVSTCDILSLNLPLTEKTKHLLDKRRLQLLKKGAYIVNTARGAIIEQNALVDLLESGHIAGAALDVFENEPLNGIPTEEMLKPVLLKNVVATPHIAFNSQDAFDRLGKELIENIQACIAGKPINTVN